MRKGKTKKTNFTGLARRTLAGALSLSMVFGTNIMTMADGGASTTTAPITFGKEVDFSTAGVVLAKDGNAAAIDGTTLTLGAAATTPSGVEIVNPFAGNTTLASETVADALENSGTKFNGYLFRHGTGDAAKDTYYIANITSKAQAEELAATGAVSIVTDAAAMTAYNGNWELNKGIQVINTANLVSATAEAAEVSFPVPEWKNGITVSAWVKASSKDYAPIFVFNNESVEGRGKSAGLAMFTDGSVVYEHGKNQNSRISVQYGGDATPANNVGKWVYVTLTVKNDGFEVYYNGQKASITKDKYSQTKSGIKYTNYGYGYVDGKDTASRIAGRVSSNGYAQRLTGLTVETLNAAPSTIFNYKAWASGYDSNQSKYPSIMEYLTKADTKLYIGGVAEGTCFGWNNLANGKSDNFAYRTACEGLSVDKFTLNDTPVSEATAQNMYHKVLTEKVMNDKADSYDFGKDGYIASGNSDVVKNGTVVIGAAATTPSGVEIVNPFAGNTTLASETVAEALENSGTKFNGYLFRHGTGDAAKDTYYIANITSKAQAEELAATGAVSIVTDAAAMTAYNGNWELNKGIQVINTANLVSATAEAAEVSFPVPEWKNGITVSAWVKASSKDYAPIFVFNNESVEGRGKSAGLAMFTDGSVVYEHGKNQNSRISVQYGGDATPANNVGKWVYVTLTVKNDGFEVYYNGQKASITKDKYSQTKSGIKYTNYGYGYVDGKDTASRIAGRVSSNGYAQRLTGLTVETLNAAPSTIFNYKAWVAGYDSNQSKYPSIMEYLTKADTKLYIGGVAEGTCFGWNNLANGKSDNFAYRAASEGLAVSDITLEDTVIDSEAAQIYYENAETPIDPTEEAKVLSEKAVSVDSKDVIASGNAATVNKATVKLGASATTPSGVEVTNPYAGNETLASETVAEALKNSGTKFNGYLFRHGTGDANDTYYIANITSKAQAEELAATGAISIVTDAAAMTAYNGNWELNKGIQVINTANLVSATAEAAEVSLPVPEWKNGITVSTWVKAATSEAVAPIFVFNNESVQGKGKSAGLAMFTDGSVIYEQGGNKNNRISVQYGGDATPIKHVGEWVYVTLTVKNDGFEVYYNGQKASVTKDKYNQGKGNIKYTNYGFGYADSNLASRIAKRVGQGAYAQRITGLTAEVIKANPSVITNYSAWAAGFDSHQSEYPSIMEYLTKADTKLYIGGLADGICYDWNGLAGGGFSDFSYTAASEGMEVSDMTLDSHVIDENAAWIYYKNAKNPDEEVVTPSPEPTTGAAVTTEPAATTEPAVPTAEPITRAAIASYDYTIDDDENINGVDRLNSDLNKSEISKDEFGNSTIKLGVGADGEIPKGVRITNPFKKNTELHETLVEALENTGVHFNGWTKAVSGSALGSSTDYYQVQDSATREDAINKFNETNKKKIEEYKRQQITSYAKSITVTGGGVEISGDGVTTSVVAVKTDADMSLMDIMSVNARVYYQTKDNVDNMTKFDGTTGRVNIASGKNLAKVLNNLSMYVDVDTILSWTGGYIKSYDECLAANKLGKTLDEYIGGVSPEITTTGEYAFPYPTWTKGVSVSTWVKVPAKAEDTTGSAASGEAVTDEAVTYPTVFEFSDNVASLYLKSDGTLKFMASSDISSNAGKNMFMAEFAGETPAKHAGEWVYVTLTVSNDNIDVYYNGVKATMKSKFAQGSTQTKYFNYGTGYGTADIDARIKACVEGNNYRDLLENYGMSTTYDDYSKYKFNTTDNYLLMVDFLTQDKTNLFFGGNDQGTESNYTDVNAGMEYGAISFYDYVAADSVVADQYEAAKKIREKAETPSPEPTTPAPTTSAPATTAPATPTPTTPVTPGPTTPAPATPTPTTPVTPGPTTPAPANTVLGDANLDNKVDLQDAVVVLKAALNINELTGQAAINADADKNGKVDLQDAVLVLKAALNILELK